jgi:hypothetical protein
MNGVIETNIKATDIVVCKNEKPLTGNEVGPPLALDQEYPVEEVHECSCKQKHLHVGLKSRFTYVRCYNCNEELPEGNVKHWCHPSRFEIKA